MKYLFCIAVAVAVIIGCTATQQTITIKTIGSLEAATDAAYKGYIALVLQGKLATNDVPKVAHAFNDFQAAALLATITAKNNTNALAPDALIEESGAVVNLITTIKGGK